MATHDVGDAVRVSCTFRNEAGVLADPTSVTLRVTPPDEDTGTVVANTRVSLGIYTGVMTPDQHGIWRYEFVGTGAVAQRQEGVFYVRRPSSTLEVEE